MNVYSRPMPREGARKTNASKAGQAPPQKADIGCWLFLAERLDESDRIAVAHEVDGDSDIGYRAA
jgi:hypothetical protein